MSNNETTRDPWLPAQNAKEVIQDLKDSWAATLKHEMEMLQIAESHLAERREQFERVERIVQGLEGL